MYLLTDLVIITILIGISVVLVGLFLLIKDLERVFNENQPKQYELPFDLKE